MITFCTDKSVFDAALDRIRYIYDNYDDVVVSMSGGKDSAVVYELTKIVAKEKGRLPVSVMWLDQECEWQATVDYMSDVMHDPDVRPYWFQIPFDFTNSLDHKKNFIHLWNEADKDMWCHPRDPIAIYENPTSENRFHDLMGRCTSIASERTPRTGASYAE